MGRGSRPIKRWRNDRTRKKKERDKRHAAEVGGPRESEARVVVSLVTAIHLYVTDLDRSNDWYTRLLGHGPAAAYDEGENAHSAFFVLEGQTFLVLTWDPERGREIGGSRPPRARRRGHPDRDRPARAAGHRGRQDHPDALRHGGLRPRRPGRTPRPHRAGLDAARHRGRGLVLGPPVPRSSTRDRARGRRRPRSSSRRPSASGSRRTSCVRGEDAAEVARAAASGGRRALGVAGGDGSLGAVAGRGPRARPAVRRRPLRDAKPFRARPRARPGRPARGAAGVPGAGAAWWTSAPSTAALFLNNVSLGHLRELRPRPAAQDAQPADGAPRACSRRPSAARGRRSRSPSTSTGATRSAAR